MKIAFNAEPFGYGPAAAIYLIKRKLEPIISWSTYIGKGHTLNFNTDKIYDSIVDISFRSKEELLSIIDSHDFFITACDFEMASLGKLTNTKIILYDMLTWHWEKIPEIINEIDIYIAQDFFGVKERIDSISMRQGKTFISEPIIPEETFTVAHKEGTLFNIGGVSNPFLSDNLASDFVTTILGVLNDKLLNIDRSIQFNINPKLISSSLLETVNVDPHESAKRLSKANLAILSPGLGNIYESSYYSKSVIWLPPLNNSQGQQLSFLRKHFPKTLHLDWSLFIPEIEINYFDEQPKVMEIIKSCMQRFIKEEEIQVRFMDIFNECVDNTASNDDNAHKELINLFGENGLNQIFDLLSEYQ